MAVIGTVEFDEKQIKQLSTFEQTLIKIVNPLFFKASTGTGASTFATAQTGNIGVGPSGALNTFLRFLLTFEAGNVLIRLNNDLNNLFEVDPSPANLEDRIKALQEKAGELRVSIAGAQSALDLLGEDPNSIIGGIPITQEAINEQIDIAKSLEEQIILLKKQLDREQSGIVLEIPVDFQLPANANLSPLLRDLDILNPEDGQSLLDTDQINQGKEALTQYGFALGGVSGAIALTVVGAIEGAQAQEKYNQEVAQAEKKIEGFGKEALGAGKDAKKLVKEVGDLNDETSDIDIEDKLSNIDVDTVDPEEIIPPGTVEKIETIGPAVTKSTDEGKRGLSSLGVFAGNIATNIAESFSGFISTAIKGDFDGIGDLWDDLLDSLQNSFADLIGGFLTNPFRVAFETTLKGEGGITDFFKDLFGGGGKEKTEENQQNVIFLDYFREKVEKIRLAA